MSLVNDMLRDLEQRNERPTQMPGQQSNVKAAQFVEEAPASKAPRIALWMIGMLAVATTLWLLWQQQTTVHLASEQQEDTSSAVTTITSEADKQVLPLEGGGTEPNKGESIQSPVIVAEPDVAAETVTFVETVAINEIKWAAADFGGDLVVRLNGEADIQVLNQKDDVIVIAFDDVALRATLPSIPSRFVRGLAIEADSEQNRALLTLTTHRKSQFSFRVQTSPTTLILGVIPEEISLPAEDSSLTRSTSVERDNPESDDGVVEQPSKVDIVDTTRPVIRSAAELQVNAVEGERSNEVVMSKPVTKSTKLLTDRQVTERARRMISKGDVVGAEKLLTQSISKMPTKAERSRSLLATLLLSKGETVAAQVLIQQSRDLYPKNSELKKLQARIWVAEGKASQTVSMLSSKPPAIEEDREYHELLASAYQQDNNPEQAARIYFQLLQLNNRNPRWWVGMGYALEQVKRYADARNAYQSALQIPTIDSRLNNYANQRINALVGR